MSRRWIAAALVLGSLAVGASSCQTEEPKDGKPCDSGAGHWIEDESETITSKYSSDVVIVRICVDDGGNVIDLEVD